LLAGGVGVKRAELRGSAAWRWALRLLMRWGGAYLAAWA